MGAALRGTLSAEEAASDVDGFSDVPPGLVTSYGWKSLQARAWMHELAEPIHLKELRGGLWVVRHWCRSLTESSKSLLIAERQLGDCFGVGQRAGVRPEDQLLAASSVRLLPGCSDSSPMPLDHVGD